jgi:acyl-CoA synthetase (AMP-forming)/AMP-acid ligase II
MTTLPPHHHSLRDDEVSRRRLRSVGRATPNVKISIREEDGSVLPPGSVGEIAALSPGGMDGLWNDPDATAARLLPDGSILTRDMGYLDEDGFLYLVDRKDDMIISGGYNIWPSEIEAVLMGHSAVAEVCVVGVPHDRWGETPRAFVVPSSWEDAPSEEELIAYTRERLGGVKKVTSVEFVPQLPKSGTGKVKREVLKASHWSGQERRVGET